MATRSVSFDGASNWRERLRAGVCAVVRIAGERALWVLLAYVALLFFSSRYTIENLGVDTDTADMIAPHLDWRVRLNELKRNVQLSNGNLTVIVASDSSAAAHSAVSELAQTIGAIPDGNFESVYAPSMNEFLARNGLLFLSTTELDDLAESLLRAQPSIGFLQQRPDATRIIELLTKLRIQDPTPNSQSARFINAVSSSIDTVTVGAIKALDWSELMFPTSDDAQALSIISVDAKLDFSALFPAMEPITQLRSIADDVRSRHAEITSISVTGAAAMAHDEMVTVSHGMGTAAAGALLLVVAALWIGLRSWRMTVIVLFTLLSGLVLTATFAAATVADLNLISIAFAVLYIGMGVDYAIHFCMRVRELAAQGIGCHEALNAAAEDVGFALVVCALTTAVGFMAFVPTNFVGVSELGIIATGGMAISLLVSFTLLPALLTLAWSTNAYAIAKPTLATTFTPTGAAAHGTADSSNNNQPAHLHVDSSQPARHAFLSSKRRGWWLGWRQGRVRVVAVLVGLTIVGCLTLPSARFDHNPINLRDQQTESVAAYLQLMTKPELAPWTLSVLRADEALPDLKQQLLALRSVAAVRELNDFVPTEQAAKLAQIDDIALEYAGTLVPVALQRSNIAALQAAIAQFVESRPAQTQPQWRVLGDALAELQVALQLDVASVTAARLDKALLRYLPSQLARLERALDAQTFARADLSARLRSSWVARDGRHRIEVRPSGDLSDNEQLADFVTAVQSVAPDATGTPELNLRSSAVVVAAFQQAFVSAVLMIGILLYGLTGRVSDVLCVLLPLLLAALLTTAVMTWFGIAFNFANVICLPLLLGVGVDNGVHMLHRARALQGSMVANLTDTTMTKRAIVLSALTTVCGFGNLAFSSHPGTASMGLVLTIGLFVSVAITLVTVPVLVTRYECGAGG